MNARYIPTPFTGQEIENSMVMYPSVDYHAHEDFDIDEDGDEVVTDEYVLIDMVSVPAHLRGQGIARRMLGEALEAIRAEYPGWRIVLLPRDTVSPDTDIDRLVAFYESMGFCDDENEIGSMSL